VAEQAAVRVLGACGSLRPDSWTRVALTIALAGAEEMGATAELVDLRDYDLPFCTGEESTVEKPGVRRLRPRQTITVRLAAC
jgi:FMN reductase